LLRISKVVRREITPSRADRELVDTDDFYAQLMILAVFLQILRGKPELINKFRQGSDAAEAFGQIIIVMKKSATGSIGKFREHIGVCDLVVFVGNQDWH